MRSEVIFEKKSTFFSKKIALRKKIAYLCFYFVASNDRNLFFEKYLGSCRSEELLRLGNHKILVEMVQQ
jgi:hypothetical protein